MSTLKQLLEVLIVRKRRTNTLEGGDKPEVRSPHIRVSAGSPDREALVQEVSLRELTDLHRDDDVESVMETVPLQLIEPVSSDATVATETGDAWGIAAVGAATSQFSGKGVTVAVLDTGIDLTHPAFAGVQFITKNFTTDGSANDVSDKHGHGTHCAGTIFGRDVGGQRIGIARGVERAIIGKVLGPRGASTGTLFTAMNWAIEEGARVISMSLGMDFVGLRERLLKRGIHERAATAEILRLVIANVRFFDNFGRTLRDGAAVSRSALVLAASGNESNRRGGEPYVLGTAFPAETQEFVSVAALESTGDSGEPYRVATFSNAGAKFAAPGVNILSAALGGGLVSMSGTSMATPHAAGIAALWYQKLMLTSGKITPKKVWDQLIRTAKMFPGLDETDVGDGIPQSP